MKLQYLGTAAAEGMPAVFCQCPICREAARRGGKDLRFRTSAMVNDTLLIDISPDLYAQKLKFQLDLGNVRNIIVTHAHMDHFNREEVSMFVEPFAHLENRSRLTLYGSAFTGRVWEEYLHTALMKEPGLEGKINFRVLAPFETEEIEGVTVTALEAVHSCPESLIYLLEQDGVRLLYGNDTGVFPEKTWAYLRTQANLPLTVVSLDSTMGKPKSNYNGHMTLQQNIETRRRMLDEGIAMENTRFICHHFSHNGLVLQKEMEEMMGPEHFEIAYDGKVVEA